MTSTRTRPLPVLSLRERLDLYERTRAEVSRTVEVASETIRSIDELIAITKREMDGTP